MPPRDAHVVAVAAGGHQGLVQPLAPVERHLLGTRRIPGEHCGRRQVRPAEFALVLIQDGR
jgi:hypothetical protein